jgi:hypothetical protein
MARSLERRWPGVVETTRKFKRPQHHVKHGWAKFDNKLVRRKDVDFSKFENVDEYGMAIKQVRPTKGKYFKKWLEENALKNEREETT